MKKQIILNIEIDMYNKLLKLANNDINLIPDIILAFLKVNIKTFERIVRLK